MTPSDSTTLLEARNLRKLYPVEHGLARRLRRAERQYIHAVDNLNLSVVRGESLGIVGESGCGKSTLGRLIVRLEKPTSGTITFRGQDLTSLTERELRPLRRSFQIVFQDPSLALNPRVRIGATLGEVLTVHEMCPRGEVERSVAELLQLVELSPAVAGRYPAQLSGGQRQRVGIARALAAKPQLVVADEPVSALDVSVQAQILNLVNDLKRELGLTWIFIGHNLATVRQVSERIVVMYVGRIVEEGPANAVLGSPLHPYTQALLESVPEPDPRHTFLPPRFDSEPPSPIDLPPGCRFVNRCPLARAICGRRDPELKEIEDGRAVACFAVTDEQP